MKKTTKVINISFEEQGKVLPTHVIEGIAKGQADIRAERTMSLEDFKKRLAIISKY